MVGKTFCVANSQKQLKIEKYFLKIEIHMQVEVHVCKSRPSGNGM